MALRVRQESTQDYSHLSSAMFSSSHRIQSLEDRLSRGGSIPNRMEEIVRAKFTQNQDMKQQLLATGNLVLEEGNGWHDTFWAWTSRPYSDAGSGRTTGRALSLPVQL